MHQTRQIARAGRRGLVLPAILAVGLSLLVAWTVREIAPPSLVRDGKRLPVGLAAQHPATGHHTGGAGTPSPVADEPLPHFLGSAFLALHLLAIALAAGIPVIRRLLAHFRLPHNRFAGQLMFATLTAGSIGGALLLAARFGYGDRLPLEAALSGAVEAARYAFVATIGLTVLFGVPWGARQFPRVRS